MLAEAAAPVIPALGTLTALCLLIVALGVALLGARLFELFFGGIRSGLQKIPLFGRFISKPVMWVEQRVNSFMSQVVSNLQAAVSETWHATAFLIRWGLRETVGLTEWAARLTWYVTTRYSLPAIAARVGWAIGKQAADAAWNSLTRTRVEKIYTTVTHPEQGRIGAAIKTAVRPVAANLRAFERWTVARIGALEHAIEVAIPGTLGGLRTRVKRDEALLERAWRWIRRHEGRLAGIGAVALVTAALARAGASWIMCRNWRTAGRGVCRLDPSLLDTFLLDALAIFGTISIVELAEALLAVEDEVVAGIKRGVTELSDV